MTRRQALAAALGAGTWGGLAWYATRSSARGGPSILNASYDATRELYRTLSDIFQQNTDVHVRPSHGGSGKQALAVKEGLPADVVSLAVWPDTHELFRAGLLDAGWETRFPHRSLPYTSTIVFVVRKGNPRRIHEWRDLVEREGLRVIAANPKISGAAKLAYIAAWGAIRQAESDAAADRFVHALFNPERVPVLEGSSRTATQTFARKQIGDVHLTWESEAIIETRELAGQTEIVRPSSSLLAEPQVAIVDTNTRRHGTTKLATDFVQFLYTAPAQDVIARAGFRPCDVQARQRMQAEFSAMKLFRIDDVLPGGWLEAQARFFDDGGSFDQSYH